MFTSIADWFFCFCLFFAVWLDFVADGLDGGFRDLICRFCWSWSGEWILLGGNGKWLWIVDLISVCELIFVVVDCCFGWFYLFTDCFCAG